MEHLIRDETLLLISENIIDVDDFQRLKSDWQASELDSFLVRRILYADRAHAQATPMTAAELEALSSLLRLRSDLRVVQGVGSVDLPLLGSLSPTEIASVRRSADSFNDWREMLRLASHLIPVDVTSDEFPAHAQQVFEDVVLPAAEAVCAEVRRSVVLRKAISQEGERLVVGATAVGATAGILGSSAAAGLVGASLSAAAMVAVRTLFPRRGLDGHARILLSLGNILRTRNR